MRKHWERKGRKGKGREDIWTWPGQSSHERRQKVAVLASLRQPDTGQSHLRRENSTEKILHQTGLWVSLWDIFD